MKRLFLVACVASLLAACSDDTDAGKDSGVSPDKGRLDTTVPTGDGAAQCGAGIYPCGPYGTRTGDVVQNLEFMGYSDPDEHCKANGQKSLDTSKVVKVAWKDWYLGSSKSGCETYKKSLLWVMVSSGWCGPCKTEVSSTAAEYNKDQVDKRVGLMNIVVDNTTPGSPADEQFIKSWATTYKINFPVVMDPSFKMGGFFTRNAVPFNMLIDLKTMKVYYQQVGGSLSGIGTKITEYFK